MEKYYFLRCWYNIYTNTSQVLLQNIPKFSHSAWIVEFLFVSLLFNIGAMIEYVVVIYMDKNYEQHREIMKRK